MELYSRFTIGKENCGTVKPAYIISTSYGYDEADLTPFYTARQCAEYAKVSAATLRSNMASLTQALCHSSACWVSPYCTLPVIMVLPETVVFA